MYAKSVVPSLAFLQQDSFYQKSQELIEQTYLQPLKTWALGNTRSLKPSPDLKNGRIEREIHGAMHASRVSIYVGILHQIIKIQFNVYVHKSIHSLQINLHFDEYSLLLLTRYVALSHDAGRQGEGRDLWEKESAIIAKKFLIENGLDPLQAEAFSLLVEYKDKAKQLEIYLNKLGFSPDVISGFDYLRRLISLADCFDIIRCTRYFEFSIAEEQLESIPNFDKTLHSRLFFEFAKEVFFLLKQQKDLYFPTCLYFNEEKFSLPEEESEYSPAVKVKYEHADNVLAIMVKQMVLNSYFRSYLAPEINELIENSQLSEVQLAYNPYIHGTNSSIFPILAATDFKIKSPMDLIEQHLLAPMSGELVRGGLESVKFRSNPCFGQLSCLTGYSLERIIKEYANAKTPPSASEALTELQREINYASQLLFSNFNLVLVYAARYRQLQGTMKEIDLKLISSKFNSVIGIFYLYLIISEHLEGKNAEEFSNDLMTAYKTYFTAELLINKIQESQLNLAEIYNSPSPQNLEKVLDLLDLPKNYTFNTYNRQITIQDTQSFKIKTSNRDNYKYFAFSTEANLNTIYKNDGGYRIHSMLYQLSQNQGVSHLKEHFINYIQLLESRFALLQMICTVPMQHSICTEENNLFINEPFPIILLYNQDKKIRISDFAKQEYRATSQLIFGEDITAIATDTENNQLLLIQYFKEKNLKINVLLFNELFEARNRLYPTTQILSSHENKQTFFPSAKSSIPKEDSLQLAHHLPVNYFRFSARAMSVMLVLAVIIAFYLNNQENIDNAPFRLS